MSGTSTISKQKPLKSLALLGNLRLCWENVPPKAEMGNFQPLCCFFSFWLNTRLKYHQQCGFWRIHENALEVRKLVFCSVFFFFKATRLFLKWITEWVRWRLEVHTAFSSQLLAAQVCCQASPPRSTSPPARLSVVASLTVMAIIDYKERTFSPHLIFWSVNTLRAWPRGRLMSITLDKYCHA